MIVDVKRAIASAIDKPGVWIGGSVGVGQEEFDVRVFADDPMGTIYIRPTKYESTFGVRLPSKGSWRGLPGHDIEFMTEPNGEAGIVHYRYSE